MLIICPKCFTQYQIADENASLKGKKCHCSACGCYFEAEEEVVQLTPLQQEKTALEKTMDIFDVSEKEAPEFEKESYEPISLSLFNEPIKDPKEPKFISSPLEYVPEEFKPVPSKKTPLFSLLIWLSLAGGICYAAYLQKDLMVKFMNQTIEKVFASDEKKLVKEKKSIQPTLAKMEPAVLDQKAVQIVEQNELKELPLVEDPVLNKEDVQIKEPLNEKIVVSTPSKALESEASLSQAEVKEIQAESVSQATALSAPEEPQATEEPLPNLVEALQVQNISYEIGLNEVGMERLLIKGLIVNTSLHQQKLPLTKAVVYDASDRVVARKRIVYLEKVIDGNSEIPFEAFVVPAPKSVSKIEVNFDE